MWFLFVTTVLPGRGSTGGEIVSRSIVHALQATGAEVRVLGYSRPGDATALEAGETCVGERPIETRDAGSRAIAWFALALARGIPYSSAKYYSGALLAAVRRALVDRPAAVFIDHAQLRFIAGAIGDPQLPVVCVAHNAESDTYTQLATAANLPSRWVLRREARLIGAAEAELVERATQVWALTGSDAAALQATHPAADVRTLQICSAVTMAMRAAPTCDIGLIGTWSWRSNAIGLRWFSEHVVPLLPRGLRIEVAGRGADWLQGRHPNLIVRGWVDDAQEFLAAARVVAVPALAGSGIQIKTLDAIASGAPVVATPVAVRGIDAPPGSVAVTEEPAEFAARLEEFAGAASTRPDPRAVSWSRRRAEQFRASVAAWSQDLIRGTGDEPGVPGAGKASELG